MLTKTVSEKYPFLTKRWPFPLSLSLWRLVVETEETIILSGDWYYKDLIYPVLIALAKDYATGRNYIEFLISSPMISDGLEDYDFISGKTKPASEFMNIRVVSRDKNTEDVHDDIYKTVYNALVMGLTYE